MLVQLGTAHVFSAGGFPPAGGKTWLEAQTLCNLIQSNLLLTTATREGDTSHARLRTLHNLWGTPSRA